MFPRQLQEKIDYSVNLLQKAEKLALQLDPENGFFLSFSGGKDSQTLYHIAKIAGVKFKAYMALTSIDPPQVIRFVKANYPDVTLIKPKISIYDMAVKKHMLPTRTLRWCCAEYKEIHGAGKVTLIGIRRQESARRSKRDEFSTGRRGKSGSFSGNFDQFSEHKESEVSCMGNGKEKILLSPILNWTDADVWGFLNGSNIKHCELYDMGYKRIGCILCPMSNLKQKISDIETFPHVKRKWIQTIRKLIDMGYINHNFIDPEVGFKWWISGKNFNQYYAEEFLQQKIDFEDYE